MTVTINRFYNYRAEYSYGQLEVGTYIEPKIFYIDLLYYTNYIEEDTGGSRRYAVAYDNIGQYNETFSYIGKIFPKVSNLYNLTSDKMQKLGSSYRYNYFVRNYETYNVYTYG